MRQTRRREPTPAESEGRGTRIRLTGGVVYQQPRAMRLLHGPNSTFVSLSSTPCASPPVGCRSGYPCAPYCLAGLASPATISLEYCRLRKTLSVCVSLELL